MPATVVSGRMAILFDKVALPVGGASEDSVSGYRCRWCGWTYVVDEPKLIPDHECRGAQAAEGSQRERGR
jgi:hypothetical protein